MAQRKTAAKDELTPMMRQFADLKAKHPDALLLFRCGDFYETYQQDALVAADILGIALTKRSNGGSPTAQATAMAGFPHHALDTYLPRLIRAGKRVAICDQLEDPKLAKKLVKRGITELVTPGVAMTDSLLQGKENNFLAAVHFGRASVGIAFLDISTGEFLVAEGTADYVQKLAGSFAPKEIVYRRPATGTPERSAEHAQIAAWFDSGTGAATHPLLSPLDDWVFSLDEATRRLTRQFQVKSLRGFGVQHMEAAIVAAGAALHYLEQTLHTQTRHIRALQPIEESSYVRLDPFTVRALELVEPMHAGGTSLLSVIDKTVSPMGARLLHRWILFPLKDVAKIEARQQVVEQFFREPSLRDTLQDQLAQVGDLERIASKVATQRATPRDMQQLRVALQTLVGVQQLCQQSTEPHLQQTGTDIDLCADLRTRIARELQNDPPALVSKGGVIAQGVSDELDELRHIAFSGKDYLLQLQQREIQATGINSLKIGFNNVFGYYFEVRNTFKDKVPADWIRRQTLVQAERYITEELKEYESKIMGAEERIQSLEESLFAQLVSAAAEYLPAIQRDAHLIARLDCLLAFAIAAKQYRYVRPVVDNSLVIDIRQGRHPVIERNMPIGEQYVPNDTLLDADSQQVIMLTGPNMAGKSALLRQTALITLLAQTGAFVPAESAHIGLCDKLFTRVGASDNISVGESTFMVEMTEAAAILNNLTPRSLVLFDELGRGTSTYDGLSIAWAIVEHIHENPNAHARTLFATHYHELNEMERLFQRVKNYNISVREVGSKVIFLRKLERGGCEHSFGIYVAKIAGLQPSIVKRAEQVLKQLEDINAGEHVKRAPTDQLTAAPATQLSFFQLDDPILTDIRDQLLHLDINNLTPVEALNKLNDIKRLVKEK